MKSITEEQRQELIATIKKWLPIMKAQANLIYSHPDSGRNVEIFEIALASLTAEPVGNVVSMKSYNGGLTEARVQMCKPGIPANIGDIYTAPPVPVIKLQIVMEAMARSDEASDLSLSQRLSIAEDIMNHINGSGE